MYFLIFDFGFSFDLQTLICNKVRKSSSQLDDRVCTFGAIGKCFGQNVFLDRKFFDGHHTIIAWISP